MGPLAAAGISAGVGLVSNYFGGQQQAASNEKIANRNNLAQDRLFRKNVELQKEFAKNGIQWKAKDARAAGINPLIAMGANTTSFNPVQVGHSEAPGFDYAGMGQDLSRAANTMLDGYTRQQAQEEQVQMNQLQLENQRLQNDMLRSQIARMNSAQMSPGIPTDQGIAPHLLDGQGNSPRVVLKPSERTVSASGMPHVQAGHVSDVGFARTSTGLSPVPSVDVKERIEDQTVPETMWALRNNLVPTIKSLTGSNDSNAPSLKDNPLPRGYTWKFNPYHQEYRPYHIKSGKMVPLDELYNKPQGGW